MSWKVKFDVKCSDIFYDDLVQILFQKAEKKLEKVRDQKSKQKAFS